MVIQENSDSINIHAQTGVKVSGHVKIINGDTVIEGKNKLTSVFLMTLVSWLASNTANYYNHISQGLGDNAYVYTYLGTDTTTQTTDGTSSLTAPIGGPTKNSTITGSSWTSGNAYHLQYMATYNPGTISGTVGEIGLYLGLRDSLLSAGGTYGLSGARLGARFAVADSEFSAFTIDATKPVVIIWVIKIETDLKFMNQGCQVLANIIGATTTSGNNPVYSISYGWTSKTTYMVIGSNTSSGNTAGLTGLVAPIGSSPGTKPTTQSFSTTAVSSGVYKVTYTGTWNAGSVSGTVGEIGLYLAIWNTGFQGFHTCSQQQSTTLFVARRSAADGHFVSFSIDTGKPLTISWDIVFTWA